MVRGGPCNKGLPGPVGARVLFKHRMGHKAETPQREKRSLEGNQVAGLHHASWMAFPGGRRPGRMKYVPMCPSSGLGSSEFIDASWMPVLGVYQEESPSLCHLLRTTSPEVVSGRCHKVTKVLPDFQTQCGGPLVLRAPPLTPPPPPQHTLHHHSRALCSSLSTRLQSDYTLRCPALHAAHRMEPFINTKAN